MGAAGLSKIRWFPGWPNTLGCRPDASWFAQMPRAQAWEGTSWGESPGDSPGMLCSGGGSGALEPRPWNQGGRAQVPTRLRSSRSRIPQSSRLQGTADEGAQGARQRVSGPTVLKGPSSENPMSGSGPSESARPEGEQTVEGVRNPGDGWSRAVDGPGRVDPSAEVAEGARNLDEGRAGPAGPVRALGPEP